MSTVVMPTEIAQEAPVYHVGDQVRVLNATWPGTWTVCEVHPATARLVRNDGGRTTVLTAFLSFVVPVSNPIATTS